MDKLKKVKIGKILSFIGAVCFGLCLFILLCAFLGDPKEFLIYIGIAGMVVAAALLIPGFCFMYIDDKASKEKCKEYASYPDTNISDYKSELEAVRANFAADTNPEKNKIVKVNYGFSDATPAYDFNIIKSGKIYYAYLVEANNDLFKKGKTITLPAVVVYSPDEYYENNPLELKKIAAQLFAERDSNILRNEWKYFFNLRVPQDKTGGRVVYMTTLMIYRYHLPQWYLSDSLLPVIASPETSKSVFVVDVKYWTKNLIGAFVNGASLRD